MNSLSSYLNKNGSDKCQNHTYQIIYNTLGESYGKDSALDILEVGVEEGGSLSAWKEYFTNANITGVDIVDSRLDKYKRDDVEFVLSDIKDYKFTKKFDMIIEDGSHSNSDALWAGENLAKQLKVGGSLIIEDVQEAFMVAFLLWGKLHGGYIVNAIDMRRLNNGHDNFVILIQYVKELTTETIEVTPQWRKKLNSAN